MKGWLWFIIFPSILVVVAGVYWLGYGAGTDRERLANIKALEKQKAEIKAECVIAQNITTGASNVYQSGLSQLDSDLADVMQQQSCLEILPESSPTGRPDAANGHNQPSKRNAVHSDRLYGFSGKCEKDRLKVIGLQKFMRDERK